MINNRQGGRRRGRGGQSGGGGGGGGGGRNLQPGNRQDNRQRGNAAQLLEKYKGMARDAQLAGDRVQTEYFLQFADHYFRVLGESRARFEEQNPRRQRDDEMDEDDGDEELADASEDGAPDDREERYERPERVERAERPERFERSEPRVARGDRPGRRDRPRRSEGEERGGEGGQAHANGGGETIPFDVLPPAIGRDDSATSDDRNEDAPRPRRRPRAARPAVDDDGEIAPAA